MTETTTAIAELPDDAPARTFWARAAAVYRSRALNRIAIMWVLALIVLAIIVPFIANSAPYTCLIADDDGVLHRQFPLFRNLVRVDLILLVAAFAAVLAYVIYRLIERRGGDIEVRRAARLRWLGSLFLLTALTCGAIYAFKGDFLDTRDYHDPAQLKQVSSAVYPPLRWGYKDQEPLARGELFSYPSRHHLLGTDGNGRDALARLLWSSRVVLAIGLVSEVIALVIGVIYGALMGYFSGTVDILGMRFVEIVDAIPTIFLLITFVALYGRNLLMLMVIIGLTSWTGIATFVRAEFLRIRKLDYVHAAVAMGLPLRSILFRHMLPNGLTPVIVVFTFGVAGAVVSESVLSFLGIGVEPPTASWGMMLNEAGNPAETFRWWLAIAPGFLIFVTVFAYNLIGEGLRDAIDPRMNKVE